MTIFREMTACLLCLCILFFSFSVQVASALDPKQADAEIAKMLDKIMKTANASNLDFEKLGAANQELLKYLKTASVQPLLMSDPLKKAVDAGLKAVVSDDKKLRCYSWDTLTGGTMHVFYSLIAYDAGANQIKCDVKNPTSKSAEGDPGSAFEEVDTIKTKDGKTVYLVQDLFIGSGLIHGRTITAYVIAGGKLVKYLFFQPASKKLLDTISFDFAEYGDATQFELSDDKKVLKVPLIKPAAADSPGSGTATGKYLNYNFDGNRFVFGKGK